MKDEQTDIDNALVLRIATDLTAGAGLPAEIAFNYDELKSQLSAYVAKYDGLVVGENDVPEARRIRADINGVISQLTRANTETKAKWNAPLEVFSARVKELVGIARPIEAKIGEQIKAYDASRRAAKRKTLEAYMAGLVAERSGAAYNEDVAAKFRESGHWAGVVREEWLAQSFSVKRAQDMIEAEVRRCMEEMAVISRMYAERGRADMECAMYTLIRWDFDAQTAIREVDRQIAEKERIAAREKAEAERRAALERAAAERAEQEAAKAAQTASPVPSHVQPSTQPVAKADSMEAAKAELAARRGNPQPQTPPETPAPQVAGNAPKGGDGDEPEMTYTLRITGKRSSLFALRNWLNENGLRFEKV